jgi:hypothetical protein
VDDSGNVGASRDQSEAPWRQDPGRGRAHGRAGRARRVDHLRPLAQEPVTWVDLDAEAGALEMMPHDVLQDRQKERVIQQQLLMAVPASA